MEDKLTWKAEITFKGTADEFNKFSAAMDKFNVDFTIPDWIKIPNHLAGCFPFPVDTILIKEHVKKITDGMKEIQINYIRDIRGGIRTPHIHLGDRIVLLNRNRFKLMVKNIAEELAEMRVDRMSDYIDVMKPVGDIGRFGQFVK